MEKIPNNPYNSINATNRDLFFLLTQTDANEESVSIDKDKALQTGREYLEILESQEDEELSGLRSGWICSSFQIEKDELIQKIKAILEN